MLNSIEPKPKNFEGYNDIVEFFFSIQDFYIYNPQAYEEIIDNVDNFLNIYEDLKIGTQFCEDKYKIADSKKRNALNALHSIIYNISANEPVITDKLNVAHKTLEDILNKYQGEILKICNHALIDEGYNMTRKLLTNGPSPHNIYPKETSNYEFY